MKTTIPDTHLNDPAVQRATFGIYDAASPAVQRATEKTEVTLEFASESDAQYFLNYFDIAKVAEGTVGGLNASLMCSALKRARITRWRTP